MSKATTLIAALDRTLAGYGQNITLRRVNGKAPNVTFSDVTIRGKVRSPSDKQIALGIKESDSIVIMSMTQILRSQWPSGQAATTDNVEPSLPRRLDRMIIDGRDRQVDFVQPFRINQTVVRVEVRVLG